MLGDDGQNLGDMYYIYSFWMTKSGETYIVLCMHTRGSIGCIVALLKGGGAS